MKIITKKWLKEKEACTDGYKWACDILQDKPMHVKEFINITAEHRLDWANWVICRVFDKPNKVRYAIFAAEQVIYLFENKYPDDKRPRKAIDAAKAWLDNPSATYADSASSAAFAASAASASSAASAAYAVSAAYAASAASAASATYAVSAASEDSAAYAASAASAASADSKKEMQRKILDYGISLLEDL